MTRTLSRPPAAPRLAARLRELSVRLRHRQPELERAILARAYGVSDPESVADPAYVVGLRVAVAAAVESGVGVIGCGREPPIPAELTTQARQAARNDVCLDTVLRRYFAGYALLCDFIVAAAGEGGGIAASDLQAALRTEAALLDRLVIAITAEYTREAARRLPLSAGQRRAERVRELLAGELAGLDELRYEFDGWHVAAVAAGPVPPDAVRDLATTLDRSLLLVQPEEGELWFWLGGGERAEPREALRLAARFLPEQALLALGEPGLGLEGWRDSHRQARSALPVAKHGTAKQVRYADVALVASALRDDVLMKSLHDTYLAPLRSGRDEGRAFLLTLRAYFDAERNVSSAAAALRVDRRTVTNRLRAIEELLGRPLGSCGAELEAALRLECFLAGHYERLDLGAGPARTT